MQEDDPVTWETSYLHLENRCNGGPVTTLRLVVGLGAPAAGLRISAHRVVGRLQGGTGAAADGEEESEDCEVATKSGNWEGTGTRRSEGGPC